MKDIDKVVTVDLSDIISLDLEGFLDLLSDKATQTPVLQNIDYKLVGIVDKQNTVKIQVTGELDAELK